MSTLSAEQHLLLESWCPGIEIVRDHSWGLVDTVVQEGVTADGRRVIIKASGQDNHHLVREIAAHREWVPVLASTGHAPVLLHEDADARLLVTHYLPGQLVENTASESKPETYRQAGALLARIHSSTSQVDIGYEEALRKKALAWLDKPHRIEPIAETRLREVIASWPTPPVTLVPTHGDWQPRNWLDDESTIRIIDFGRAEHRPAASDFARLATQQFVGRRDLETAFLDGYGDDPREPDAWHRMLIREAIGTAAWAFQVRDEGFEAQGHRMIADALRAYS